MKNIIPPRAIYIAIGIVIIILFNNIGLPESTVKELKKLLSNH